MTFFSQHALLCVSLCLIVSTVCEAKKEKTSDSGTHQCRITKGYKLQSFVKGKANIQLPCRYTLTEFACHTRTRVWAESSFSSKDGYAYVSGVGVTITRDTQDKQGNTVEETDTASIDMSAFKKFLEGGDLEASPWNTSQQVLLDMASGGSSWRLRDTYNEDKRQTVLTDGSGELAVTLNYVDGKVDKSKKGALTVSCSSPSFGGLGSTSGYLCGNLGGGEQEADTKTHFKEAAAKLKMSTTLYLIYNMLVAERVPQINPTCEEAAEVTSKCVIPEEAVKACGMLLDAKSYAKCFVKERIDPLEAYAQCVKWKCRKDILSCRTLEGHMEKCPGKLKSELKCGGGGGGGTGRYR